MLNIQEPRSPEKWFSVPVSQLVWQYSIFGNILYYISYHDIAVKLANEGAVQGRRKKDRGV